MQLHASVIQKIQLVYQDIHRYPARKYYIADLARQAGLTVEAFNAAFKQYYHLTIPECITGAKMEMATRLLLDHHPIKQVAAELGYKQVINFHKTFKKHTGLTPRQYYLRHKTS